MENNYERMRMPELKALAQRNGSRGYSKMRKDDLIRFICENEPPPQTIDEIMGPEGTQAKPIITSSQLNNLKTLISYQKVRKSIGEPKLLS